MLVWKVERINRTAEPEGFLADKKVKPLEGLLENTLNERTQWGWNIFSIITAGHEGDVYVVYNKEK